MARSAWWTTAEAAAAWGVTPARVRQLCTAKRVPGAECDGQGPRALWRIPRGAKKPADYTVGRKARESTKEATR